MIHAHDDDTCHFQNNRITYLKYKESSCDDAWREKHQLDGVRSEEKTFHTPLPGEEKR